MALTNIQKAAALLKSLESGDGHPLKYINPRKYIQHNPHIPDGLNGLIGLRSKLPKEAKYDTIRIFADGDFVIAHSKYFFGRWRVSVDIFRFEDGLMVEHWDNSQDYLEPNPSGHDMTGGSSDVEDLDLTEANRNLLTNHFRDLAGGRLDLLPGYYSADYVQHNPWSGDTFQSVLDGLKKLAGNGGSFKYRRTHRLFCNGNFGLAINECELNGINTSIYDLYRFKDNKIVEHWDVIEPIVTSDQDYHNNGKFTSIDKG